MFSGEDMIGDGQAIQSSRFVAVRWLKQSAKDFLEWSSIAGAAKMRASTMGEAISRVTHPSWYSGAPGEVARSLPEALRNCDALSFSQISEAVAYAGLHLLDRYGRVMQVLEHLMQIGRLPIRRVGLKVLEVGSGPAPALYAVRDFYSMLREWPGRGSTEIADIQFADSLERGEAWDRVLHHVSEQLMVVRGDIQGASGLPFRRSINDFSGFDTQLRHHQAVALHAQQLFRDSDWADEPISLKAAFRMAYQNGGSAPSAYDLVFMCNFLTQTAMTQQFGDELKKISRALTPGGVLVVMGGTGRQYPAIYEEVCNIASDARLTDISPTNVFDANLSPHLQIVCEHMRSNVAAALANCPDKERLDIRSRLPEDLWNPDVEFVLPKYQVLAFAMQKKP
jgi:ribosomal protein RSM22 (predicted rRNA methylase)